MFENACDGFVQRLQSMIAPVNRDWIDFEAGYMFGEDENNQAGRDEANRRLGVLSKILNVYKANSNFDVSMTEFLYDVIPGTAVMLVIEGTKTNPIVFIPIPFREITVILAKSSNSKAFYLCIKYKAKQIKNIWTDTKYQPDPTNLEKDIELLKCTKFNY